LTAPLAPVVRNMIKMASDVVKSENLIEVSMGNIANAARQWSIEQEARADAFKISK